jgi:hypothetical protein
MRRFSFYILLVYVQLQRGTFLIIEKSEMFAYKQPEAKTAEHCFHAEIVTDNHNTNSERKDT